MVNRYSKTSIEQQTQMLYLFIGFLFLCALAVALMPVGNEMKDKTRVIMYCSGAGFWIGLIGMICMALKINKRRKTSKWFKEALENQKQIGLTSFFQNREAIIADIVMVISIIVLIIAKVYSANLQVVYVIMAVFIFSFGMHCMLNGVNYKYINYIKEQKKNE